MTVIVLDVGADTLGNTRFAVSPLAEATLSVRLLGQPRLMHVHGPWMRHARAKVTGVDLDLLEAVIPAGPWIASCLLPPSQSSQPSIEDQLATLACLDPALLAGDLEAIWSDRTPPRRVQELVAAGPRGLANLAETIWDYWHAVVQPFWPRMCSVLEDDIAYRVTGLVEGGLFGLLRTLHPEITVRDNRVFIDKPHHADYVHAAAAMTLTPSIFAWPSPVIEDGEHGRFVITYPARGAARSWESGAYDEQAGDQLGRLFGRTRAAILRLTRVPMSTTQIARALGQSPPSVNAHLAVLRDNGLLTRRRAGRSVLYSQTQLAETILETTPPPSAQSS